MRGWFQQRDTCCQKTGMVNPRLAPYKKTFGFDFEMTYRGGGGGRGGVRGSVWGEGGLLRGAEGILLLPFIRFKHKADLSRQAPASQRCGARRERCSG